MITLYFAVDEINMGDFNGKTTSFNLLFKKVSEQPHPIFLFDFAIVEPSCLKHFQ